AVGALGASPAGVAFMAKVRRLDKVMPEADRTVGAAVALGWIRRFYAKAAAAEPPPAPASDEKARLAGDVTRLMFRSVDFSGLVQDKFGPELEQSFSFAPGW